MARKCRRKPKYTYPQTDYGKTRRKAAKLMSAIVHIALSGDGDCTKVAAIAELLVRHGVVESKKHGVEPDGTRIIDEISSIDESWIGV